MCCLRRRHDFGTAHTERHIEATHSVISWSKRTIFSLLCTTKARGVERRSTRRKRKCIETTAIFPALEGRLQQWIRVRIRIREQE